MSDASQEIRLVGVARAVHRRVLLKRFAQGTFAATVATMFGIATAEVAEAGCGCIGSTSFCSCSLCYSDGSCATGKSGQGCTYYTTHGGTGCWSSTNGGRCCDCAGCNTNGMAYCVCTPVGCGCGT